MYLQCQTSVWASPEFLVFQSLCHSQGDSAAFTSCNAAVKEKFAKTCQKHLGTAAGDLHEQHEQALEDCIFDLCQGAGETSAELAAEIFNS